MKKFFKIALTAYLGGLVSMWFFLVVSLGFGASFGTVWYMMEAAVLTVVTPLGLPFFLGACLAIKKSIDEGSL